MLHLRDMSFILIFISIMINHIISWIKTNMLFCPFLEYDLLLYITWMMNVNNFQIANIHPQGVAQHLLDFMAI